MMLIQNLGDISKKKGYSLLSDMLACQVDKGLIVVICLCQLDINLDTSGKEEY